MTTGKTDDTVRIKNGLMFRGGRDEKGLFVIWGPFMRDIYAIMVLVDGTWGPYKMYKNATNKALHKATQHLKWIRHAHGGLIRFKIEMIWESVPEDEMEKTYYENEEEILNEIENKTGLTRRGVVVGMGRERDCGPILRGDYFEKKAKQIFTGVGEKGTEFRVDPAPDRQREPTSGPSDPRV